MANRELADIFERIADFLDINGEDAFRVNSYRRVARALEDLTEDVADLAAAKRLEEIPGVGKATKEKIEQYVLTGHVALHDELKASMPDGLPALLEIPGMGPKKVGLVWKELGVTNIDELKAAAESGKLATLKGMGAKTAAHIVQGIAFLAQSRGRTPLGLALPLAEELAEWVRRIPKAKRVEIAGSLRRGAETIGDIDLVCESTDGAAVIRAFGKLPLVVRVLAGGDTKGSVIVRRRDGEEVQAQLRVVPKESFGAAWQYFTGSKEHNVRLRGLAKEKGWQLNEWGLMDGEKRLAGAEEQEIYDRLGLKWMPPEVREGNREFEPKALARGLIDRQDIRGDFHMHTTASDGTLTAAEMAAAAAALGYEYIAIADHSKSSTIANGLSVDRMWRQIEKLRKLNEKLDTIAVLVACECDILGDGSLDYPDTILAACDLVVASVHSGMKQERDKNTARVIRAMENPLVTILGHPTGRLLNKREPMDLDMEAIVEAAARTGTALEINASWQRLDLNDRHARLARERGVMLTIDTDAHSAQQLEQMSLGVRTARRAWAAAEDVLNTRPLYAVKQWIAKKRKKAAK
ncbi:MAG: DNA polymerase/3'-5' exonuclease PolX [Phycisphaerae bacterium]|nr:DNA polymerase/3'-5' exonuclease PolX [Phycisphaerae bacterium]NUQ47183.1 DNA polymerase/3'-5' exonuclease PolX [Phycisphaerae bacterium]